MSEATAQPVADRRSRVGLLVMDGALVLLMAWLLWVVVTGKDAEEADVTGSDASSAPSSEAVAPAATSTGANALDTTSEPR